MSASEQYHDNTFKFDVNFKHNLKKKMLVAVHVIVIN